MSSTFESLEIPNNSLLVVIGQKTFAWDVNFKGTDVEVKQNIGFY